MQWSPCLSCRLPCCPKCPGCQSELPTLYLKWTCTETPHQHHQASRSYSAVVTASTTTSSSTYAHGRGSWEDFLRVRLVDRRRGFGSSTTCQHWRGTWVLFGRDWDPEVLGFFSRGDLWTPVSAHISRTQAVKEHHNVFPRNWSIESSILYVCMFIYLTQPNCSVIVFSLGVRWGGGL